MDRNAFITRLLASAAERGVAGEVCLDGGESFEVSVKNGEIHQYNVSDSMGLGFRVLKDGHTGTASTQILDEDALTQLLEGAIENAGLVESKDQQFMYAGDESYPELDLYNPAIEAMDVARKIEMAKELEKLTLAQDQRIRQVEDCAVFSTVDDRRLTNTLGLDVSAKSALLGGYVVAVARDGEKVNTGMKLFVTMKRVEDELAYRSSPLLKRGICFSTGRAATASAVSSVHAPRISTCQLCWPALPEPIRVAYWPS